MVFVLTEGGRDALGDTAASNAKTAAARSGKRALALGRAPSPGHEGLATVKLPPLLSVAAAAANGCSGTATVALLGREPCALRRLRLAHMPVLRGLLRQQRRRHGKR